LPPDDGPLTAALTGRGRNRLHRIRYKSFGVRHSPATPAACNVAATEEAWAACAGLAAEPDILAVVARILASAGVAGEARTLKLLYLILVSRFLPRPASAAVKGPSSGGKSYALERVLDLFPEDAYYALSAP